MISITKKELKQFFSTFAGYIAIILFLIVTALYLFVLRDSNIFDIGYATLDPFFSIAPWIFIFLIPAIAMRSFSEEYRTGTFEILKTLPVSGWQIVMGKYLAVLIICLIALIPTLLYPITLSVLSTAGIDGGGIAGSYIGLIFLAAVFSSISVWCSSLSSNTVISFLAGAFFCLLLYFGFNALSKIPVFAGNIDYYIEILGIDFHYQSISRGVIDSRDIIYFLSVIYLFLFASRQNIIKG
ncbi:MAG: ABC transporter permease subunit [Chitinophagaceae bacterium]|nr:ABC transporter permease subunit [Chitinophagaceae bacterium]